ncbi:MAG TPA: hypothetical protein VN948_24070 [Terriglobales bacterium]|nr:hypothetical protein [Terriglobales bacterium]
MESLDAAIGWLAGPPDHDFLSERIADFRWSPDGKTLAVTREQDTSDVAPAKQSVETP